MRKLNAFLAVVSAVALCFAIPATASAAEGEFSYRYYDAEGEIQVGSLVDPPSRECIEIPETADWDVSAAFRPRNNTDSRAVVFKNAECEGDDYFSLRPHGGHGSDRLLLRSVIFS
ncbi:hypothetical protein BS329_30705 [Amycolatopsis coloradensis]|uniref:Beta/gamma crystallin 'Greek key' domain-containing protein n=1 Tax=Amycolatopsis coloradensis TaxID=76021 RepID=A0A1R0KJ18_9PSEU|nr:hypothetical protein [Amycolatopsis coloradensis]OLZ46044.1 hypothetical protein BS329_30705 [Amycolatopsis coloradensis]